MYWEPKDVRLEREILVHHRLKDALYFLDPSGMDSTSQIRARFRESERTYILLDHLVVLFKQVASRIVSRLLLELLNLLPLFLLKLDQSSLYIVNSLADVK